MGNYIFYGKLYFMVNGFMVSGISFTTDYLDGLIYQYLGSCWL